MNNLMSRIDNFVKSPNDEKRKLDNLLLKLEDKII
jgi:hypothetical protein